MTLRAHLPPLRIIVLAPSVSASALTQTLAPLLRDQTLTAAIEVFGEPVSGLSDHPRLRWHPPASNLPEALRHLRPIEEEVALVQAGVVVPSGGLQRLQMALQADPQIASASPLCATDPLYAPWAAATSTARRQGDEGSADSEQQPDAFDRLDAWLAVTGPCAPIEMPRPLPACTVLRQAAAGALQLPLPAGGDVSGWTALTRAGWLHSACARVLVSAPRASAAVPAAVDGERSRPGADAAGSSLLGDLRFRQSAHPLGAVREQLAREQARAAAAGSNPAWLAAPCAVRLHIAHSWGGGLSTWVRDFVEADESADDAGAAINLVLRSIGVVGAYGQRLALYRGNSSTEPVRIWQLALPIYATALAHLQYRAVLREIVADFGIDAVIVSSLIGHSLDVLRTGLPTLVVAHDHYPFCVAIFASHGGECRSCDRTRLSDCIKTNPGHRFFNGVETDDWMALREAFCEAVSRERITLIAPSPSVRERWRALMPALSGAAFALVPHGIALPAAVPFDPPADGTLRLIKLGRLSMEKGGETLEAILPELSQFAHLTLLGCGDEAAARLGGRAGVTAIAGYERDTLSMHIAQARPHLGLQLSVVPETFSYTLSELWHCGVPVLASRIGSLEDRVVEGETGYLVQTSPQAVLARLRELAGQRSALAGMRARLLAQRSRSRADMVSEYRALLPAGRVRRVEPAAAAAGGGGEDIATARHASGRIALGPISIDPETTYRQAARAFARYTLSKVLNSPRVPAGFRRVLLGLVRWRRARA